eukprot:353182-Chlamydomonas_euryale.AAC.57
MADADTGKRTARQSSVSRGGTLRDGRGIVPPRQNETRLRCVGGNESPLKPPPLLILPPPPPRPFCPGGTEPPSQTSYDVRVQPLCPPSARKLSAKVRGARKGHSLYAGRYAVESTLLNSFPLWADDTCDRNEMNNFFSRKSSRPKESAVLLSCYIA